MCRPTWSQPRVRLATSGEAALLNSTTAAAAEKMFAAAAASGVVITLASGYRSFNTQIGTYNKWVQAEGQAAADTASARPGYSEHQTGWSFDIGDGSGRDSFTPAFANQPAAVWAKANAHRFGFVVRYPWMFHEITGYYYEPWHLRYVGRGSGRRDEHQGHCDPRGVLRAGSGTGVPVAGPSPGAHAGVQAGASGDALGKEASPDSGTANDNGASLGTRHCCLVSGGLSRRQAPGPARSGPPATGAPPRPGRSPATPPQP